MDPVSSSFKLLAAWLSFSVILSLIVSSSSSAFNFFLRYERQARCILLQNHSKKAFTMIYSMLQKYLLNVQKAKLSNIKFTNSNSLCISGYFVLSMNGSIDNFGGGGNSFELPAQGS